MKNLKFLIFFVLIIFVNAKEIGLREQVSQMIIVGFHGKNLNEVTTKAMLSDLSYNRFGGVLLLGRNIQDPNQLQALTNEIKKRQKNAFISIDEEGGVVTRFKADSFKMNFASALDVASSVDINDAKILYDDMAQKLAQYGINLNFAPVLDLHDELSPIIASKKRAFSKNPAKVSLYASVFIDAMSENSILSTIKHFPGHGSAKQDSHNEKTYIMLTKEALNPFKTLISENKAKLVMIGHIYVKNLDEKYPATLSSIVINGLLRDELGYDGVVVSDDMMMKGVAGLSLKEQIIRYINAGGDILLFSEFKIDGKRTADVVYEYIKQAVNDGEISKQRIKISYDRIMKLKKELK